MDLKSKIRVIEDYPKEGISFKDITTLLLDGEAYAYAIDECKTMLDDVDFDIIIGPEARGFIVAAPLSYAMKKPFAMVRKPGKLPSEVESFEYELEYGTDVLEMHKDSIKPGQKVVIADDLLATGGTVEAVIKLVEKLGGEVVACVFFMELEFLEGAKKLGTCPIKSLIKY